MKLNNQIQNRESETRTSLHDKLKKVVTATELKWPEAKFGKDGAFLGPDATKMENYEYLIEQVLGLNLQYNDLDHVIYEGEDRFQDPELTLLYSLAYKLGLTKNPAFVLNVVFAMALKRRFNPIKDYIQSRAWDGRDRLRALQDTIELNVGDDQDSSEKRERYKTYIYKWLVGCVAKVYKPGAQNLVLVLMGPQGCGKSSWVSRLFPVGLSEGAINPNDKDHLRIHWTSWARLISEFDGVTTKQHAAALKEYFTHEKIQIRLPYARSATEARSICSFISAVNSEKFLNDPTGSRRYWVVPVLSLNFQHDIDIQQVWAQVYERFKAGDSYWQSKDEMAELLKDNQQYELEDWTDDIIAKVYEDESSFMTGTEIFQAFGHDRPTKTELSNLNQRLSQLGIKQVRKQHRGSFARGYTVRVRLAVAGENLVEKRLVR